MQAGSAGMGVLLLQEGLVIHLYHTSLYDRDELRGAVMLLSPP
jgi:hypothetical protein